MLKRCAAELVFIAYWLAMGLLCLWNAQGSDFYPSRLGRMDTPLAYWLFTRWLWILVLWMIMGASTYCLHRIWKYSESNYRNMLFFCILLLAVYPIISPSNRHGFDIALGEFFVANLLCTLLASAWNFRTNEKGKGSA